MALTLTEMVFLAAFLHGFAWSQGTNNSKSNKMSSLSCYEIIIR